jgi:hypothetical protein
MNIKRLLLTAFIVMVSPGCAPLDLSQNETVSECPVHHVPLLRISGYVQGRDVHIHILDAVADLDTNHSKDIPFHIPVNFYPHKDEVWSTPATCKYCPVCQRKWEKLRAGL